MNEINPADAKWIVTNDETYYPSVVYFTNKKDAVNFFDRLTKHLNGSFWTLAKVEEIR